MQAARTLTGVAGLAAAAALAGCSQTAASTSSVTATGSPLSIYVSVPPAIGGDPTAQQVIDGEQLAFHHDHAAQVGSYPLRLVLVSRSKLSDNARAAIQDKSAVAYLGEIAPGSSEQTVGITNAQDLLQVSPTDTALELTTRTPAVAKAPNEYYETIGTYGRTFARLVPTSAAEATAQVAEMKALHLTSLTVADDGTDYGRAIAHAVSADASAAGISVSPGPASSSAGALFFGGGPVAAAETFTSAASKSPSMKLFGDSALATSAFVASLGSAPPKQLYISAPTASSTSMRQLRALFAADGGAAGLRFPAAAQQTLQPATAYGYEAMTAVLSAFQAAGRQAIDRAKVVAAFDRLRPQASLLGSFSMNKAGDTSLGAAAFAFYRPRGGTLVPAAASR